MFWTNRNGRRHPDDRRAGCPHPAGPCGGANAPVLKLPRCGGRERPPYGAGENAAANRKIAAAQTPAGGYGIRPYGRWLGPRPNKKPQPCGIANPRRGRFHIGPDRGGAGLPGRDLRPKSRRCAAVGLRNAPAGAVNPAPTNKFYVLGNRDGRRHPGERRAGCPHPAGPHAAARSPGGYGIRPYGRWQGPRPNGKPHPKQQRRTICTN